MPWPPTSEDVTEGKVNTPDVLYNMSLSVDGACTQSVLIAVNPSPPETILRNVEYFQLARISFHCTISGCVKTLKHVVLLWLFAILQAAINLLPFYIDLGMAFLAVSKELDTSLAERRLQQNSLARYVAGI